MDNIKLYDPTYMSRKKLRSYGKNAESTQRENRMLVLRIIAESGPISRLELVHLTRLKSATITIIIKDLLDQDIVEASGRIEGKKGRRVMSFSLKNRFCTISVRVTSTYVKVGVYDINYKNLYIHKEFLNTSHDVCSTLGRVRELIDNTLSSLGSYKLLGVSVGVEGRCSLHNNDYCLWDEKTNSPIMVGKYLHDALGVPILVNRAINYAAYYTWHKLYRLDIGTVLQINLGYTIECGIIINGEIMNGLHGQAGMIGRSRVSNESDLTIENYLSTPIILAEALSLLPEYPDSYIYSKRDAINIRDIIKGFDQNDPLCTRVFESFSFRLAKVIAPMIHLLAPSLVVAGDETPVNEAFERMVRNALVPLIGQDNVGIVHTWTQGIPRESRYDPALLGGALYLLHAAIDYSNSPLYN